MGWFDKGNFRYIEIRDFDVVSFSCVEIFNGRGCFYIANVCMVER